MQACGGPPVLVHFAPLLPFSPPPLFLKNKGKYLRVVLGEEVGPSWRRGHADDKYSLDREEAENTERLRADRHFPLNIQETVDK